ncbi:MAG TPA: hypothetical protein VH331_02275 [Allosphingosinicella sp.]|jgi:hypothetical protein|nr:hypothetical protein [Allosphingosinicella sp.]
MVRGSRRYILAAIGWLILANTEQHHLPDKQGQQHLAAPPTAAKQQTSAASGQQPRQGCEGTTKPNLSCEAISAQADVDQARDANEQVTAAWWQWRVGALTLLAAVAAALFAWRAAYHTKRSADADEKLLSHGQNISRIELRPYVTLTDLKLAEVTQHGNGYRYFRFEFVFMNQGTTPARILGVYFGKTTPVFGNGLPNPETFASAPHPVWQAVIGPNHTLSASVIISEETIIDSIKPRPVPYSPHIAAKVCYGWLEGDDAFTTQQGALVGFRYAPGNKRVEMPMFAEMAELRIIT